jgi:hypothetical protein
VAACETAAAAVYVVVEAAAECAAAEVEEIVAVAAEAEEDRTYLR